MAPVGFVALLPLCLFTLSALADDGGQKAAVKKIIWVTPENLDTKDVEPAGNNNGGYDLTPVYVARGVVERTGKIPGWILDAGDVAKVGCGNGTGIDVKKEDAKVLYTPRGTVSWVAMAAGDGPTLKLPRNVILGGQYPKTRENLYICRANGEKVLPGFFQPTKKACIVWDGNEEKTFTEFEVLCINEFGMVSGAFM